MTNNTIATCNNFFLSNRSASLPHRGVLAVDASNMDVMTHVYWVCVPFRSARIVGRAFETMVELRMATSSATQMPDSASRISRCDEGRLKPAHLQKLVDVIQLYPEIV